MIKNLAFQEIFAKKLKTILVVRNPKAAALSYFQFAGSNDALEQIGAGATELTGFLEKYLEGSIPHGSWWEWNKCWIANSK